MRTIFHIDMDAFFASVEIVRQPHLKGKPVIVGGRSDRRGVVSTCSYEARAFGVHSAMPISEAHRLCPFAIFLEGDYSLYKEYSKKVIDIFYLYTPFVEVVSIDEAYLDVTELLHQDNSSLTPRQLATTIHQHVFTETKLTCSIGIATNKLVSKIAAAKAKPNGIFEVIPTTESSFLSPLPIQSIPGIGAKTQELLNREGIFKIADLQAIPFDESIQKYGAWGYYYYNSSRGEDKRPVDWEDFPPKSIGAETTFDKDLDDLQEIIVILVELIEKAHRRLILHKMRTKRISLKLRSSTFKTISRSHTLTTHLNDKETLMTEILTFFRHHYDGQTPLRLIGISFEQLGNHYWQPLLF